MPGAAAIATEPRESQFQASRGCNQRAAQSQEGYDAALRGTAEDSTARQATSSGNLLPASIAFHASKVVPHVYKSTTTSKQRLTAMLLTMLYVVDAGVFCVVAPTTPSTGSHTTAGPSACGG